MASLTFYRKTNLRKAIESTLRDSSFGLRVNSKTFEDYLDCTIKSTQMKTKPKEKKKHRYVFYIYECSNKFKPFRFKVQDVIFRKIFKHRSPPESECIARFIYALSLRILNRDIVSSGLNIKVIEELQNKGITFSNFKKRVLALLLEHASLSVIEDRIND